MTIKEAEFEKNCIQYARRHGWTCWKNENNGNTGIPDYSLLSPTGEKFLLVEFKRDARARIRPEQITWVRRYPNIVHIVNAWEQFVSIIDTEKKNNISSTDNSRLCH